MMTTKSKIPEFTNRQDEATFWDSHDFTDFADETKAVEVNVSSSLSKVLPVRLSTDVLNVLEREARRVGIGTSTLARMWILERIEKSHKANTHVNKT